MKAIFLNCTIKPSTETSNTKALMDKLANRMQELQSDLKIEHIHALDYDIKYGGGISDMGDGDEWPKLLEKLSNTDILVIGSPVWMGVRSSVTQLVIERLDGSTKGDEAQFPLYNTVAGLVVTGNEDGAHDVIANTFGNLLHFGCTCPPNTDVYWVGDAGPGASFIDAGGALSPYVNRNVELTAQNLIHGAKMLKNNHYTIDMRMIKAKMMKGMQIKGKIMMEAVGKMKEAMKSLES